MKKKLYKLKKVKISQSIFQFISLSDTEMTAIGLD